MEVNKQDLEIAGCLRRLTKNRFLLRSKNEKWFQTILDHRDKLQNVFKSFLIHLDVNEPLGVIYLRPLDPEIEETLSYQMGRKQILGPFASLLIFHLRNFRDQFFKNPTSNEVPLISLGELREFCQVFNQSEIDREFERQFRKCLEELQELQALQETASQSDLFEITAVCDLLLPADQVQEFKIKIDTYFKSNKTLSPEEQDA